MCTLLVVDDERVAVKGIVRGIDWSETPVTRVLEAYDTLSAIDMMERESVDLLVTDIEMPDKNGIELLEWVNDNRPAVKTVILTGHADFEYARRAVQLGCYEYVLKPFRYNHLKETVTAMAIEHQEEMEHVIISERYQIYAMEWERQVPVLLERFWQDILSERQLMTPEQLEMAFSLYRLPEEARDGVTVVLISTEDWLGEFNSRDEEILEFALRNAAGELLLNRMPGTIVHERSGTTLALIYGKPLDNEQLRELQCDCEAFMISCRDYLHCLVSCYIAEHRPIDRVTSAHRSLQTLEKENVSLTNAIVLERDSVATPAGPVGMPWLPDWLILLDTGEKGEVMRRFDELFGSLRKDAHVSVETLIALYNGFVYLLYYTVNRKGYSLEQIGMNGSGEEADRATRSVEHLRQFLHKRLSDAADLLTRGDRCLTMQTVKVKRYIEENLHEELSRESIASQVYLNPAYMARLFKKESGMSLSDYILKRRMEKARKLLAQSSEKITAIIDQVGFQNGSYFTKMFKKEVGITPQEYRRQYRSN
ncbi:response regulator [Paenibacillus sp. FSL H7-0331]|uniref:response regulator transcription factor n=1 Tax=Paenibacillus sp. FSL H7-0331 TaxID=1920421 RepID=UPI00096D0987|nr:helix-turn-helix domain-containing protein [Paenibacillus sp. FSL H7-0331]OMF06078.1 hypothetical protein BK127_31565 [Paenibacillus sp. FSL H7-0331]